MINPDRKTFYEDALYTVHSNIHHAVSPQDGKTTAWDIDENVVEIDEEAIETEITRLVDLWDANKYSRERSVGYPDWDTQLDKIYHDGLEKWKTEMVDPVKAKWPKDNSGPV